ncbi:MAG: hypothetical protein IPN95_16285 [Bacteroidetes bacterium]|nr:hypothetical protein [Bacteroidota bacterium]
MNLDASPDVSPEMPIAEPEPEIILPPAEPEVPVEHLNLKLRCGTRSA